MNEYKEQLLEIIEKHQTVGVTRQLDYEKFNRLSLIAHSAAMEGSSLTETECLLLLEEGIPAKGKEEKEQLIVKDLRNAYNYILPLSTQHIDFSVELLVKLAALVMQHTGKEIEGEYSNFDTSKGEFRTANATAGAGGSSYPNYTLIVPALRDLCQDVNAKRKKLLQDYNLYEVYLLSFDTCFLIESIHPWGEGNGRMARILMNVIQYEFGLTPNKIIRENKAEYLEAWLTAKDNNDIEIFETFLIREHVNNLQTEIDKYLYDNYLNPISTFIEPQKFYDEPQKKGASEPQGEIHEPHKNIHEPQHTGYDLQYSKENDPQGDSIENIILNTIKENNKITREELAEITGTSVSTIKRRLKHLGDEIEYVGSGYSGYWKLKK